MNGLWVGIRTHFHILWAGKDLDWERHASQKAAEENAASWLPALTACATRTSPPVVR